MDEAEFKRHQMRREIKAILEKQRKKEASPAGAVHASDFTENGCLWLFIVVLFVGVFVVLFSSYWWRYPPPPPPPPSTMFVPMRKRTVCMAGETFDQEAGMCGPTLRVPLALESSIMDTMHHTPSDSFYRYMSGTWIAQHENENRAFTYAHYKAQARVKQLLLVPGTPLNRFYASCVTPSQKEIQLEYKHVMETVVGSFRTRSELPQVFGRLARLGYTMPFALSVERHPLEDRVVPVITYDGFPESLDEGRIFQIMTATRAVTNYNVVEEQQRIQAILRIMRAQRDHIRSQNEDEDEEEQESYIAYVENHLARDLVRFDSLPQRWNLGGGSGGAGTASSSTSTWPLFFQALDGHSLRVQHDQIVWVPQNTRRYLQWLLTQGLAEFDALDWKAYLEFSVLYNGAQFEPELPSDVYYKRYDTRGPWRWEDRGTRSSKSSASKSRTPRSPLPHRLPRANTTHPTATPESRCTLITQHMLPGLVARAYLDAHMPNVMDVRKDVEKITARVLGAFKDLVRTTPWMSDADKDVVVRKMDATLIRVAEPETWEPEPFAEMISADRYDHNLNAIRRYRVQRNLERWHSDAPQTFDRSALALFAMPTTSINAYYSGPTNSITILAGLLQPPFYSPLYNEVSKYAILGSIIGHELSHMLDHHGLLWDATGRLVTRGILSGEGMRAFYDALDCVIVEYGPAPGGCEDANLHYGNSTAGEDLADLVGVALAFNALFGPSDGTSPLPLSDKQHFFMVLAQVFAEQYDQEHLCEAVRNDEHAIAEFRIDRTLRNMRPYHEAFGVRAGQTMYRERVCRVY